MTAYEVINFSAVGIIVLLAAALLVQSLHFRNIILAINFLVGGYNHLFVFLIEAGILDQYPGIAGLYFTNIPLGFLCGPLIYFHVLSITDNKKSISRPEWLHFLPALLSGLLLIPHIALNAEQKIQYIEKYSRGEQKIFGIGLILLACYFSIYGVLSILALKRRIKKENPLHKRIAVIELFLLSSIFIFILKIVAILTLWKPFLLFQNYVTSFSFLMLYLLYHRYPYLFQYATLSAGKPAPKKTSSRSYLTNIDIDTLANKLILLMEKENFYCDEDLTLSRLSQVLDVTPHQLSEFLNEHYNKNFNNYINEYRVAEAKKLLIKDPQRNTLSIAYAVGFNSYTAFYTAFKKSIGSSPADFRKGGTSELL
ncbi:MAG: AraC family transcriptional regulator [bacterium]|nr:AraC family transcriptional regulator [bacterium]